MRESAFINLAIVFSLGCQIVSAIFFILQQGAAGMIRAWFEQFSVIISLSCLLSVCMISRRMRKQKDLIIFTRSILVFIMCTPFVSHWELKLLLLLSLVIETGLLYAFPRNLVLIGVVFIAASGLQRSMYAWEAKFEALAPDALAMLFSIFILFSALCVAIRMVFDRFMIVERENGRLHVSVRQLTEVNLSFQEYAIRLKDQSVVAERNRISREIHDTVGYTLTNIRMMLEAAMRIKGSDPDKLLELLVNSREQAVTGLDDVRYALRSLRSLNTGGKASLIHMIHQITRSFQNATNVLVKVEYANMPWAFEEEVQVLILRLIQEGMTNALKHGNASRIDINFFVGEDGLHIVVRDNGMGSMDVKEGIGFQGMKERIDALHGNINMRNLVDGFELSAIIPPKAI